MNLSFFSVPSKSFLMRAVSPPLHLSLSERVHSLLVSRAQEVSFKLRVRLHLPPGCERDAGEARFGVFPQLSNSCSCLGKDFRSRMENDTISSSARQSFPLNIWRVSLH